MVTVRKEIHSQVALSTSLIKLATRVANLIKSTLMKPGRKESLRFSFHGHSFLCFGVKWSQK